MTPDLDALIKRDKANGRKVDAALFRAITNSTLQMTAALNYVQGYVAQAANTLTISNNYLQSPALNWITPQTKFTLGPRFAQPLGFNKYVNGSDLLEEFIAFLGTEGVRKGEIMDLPLELFIKWLVARACEVDQEDPGFVLTLPAPKAQPRCLGCKRWMKQGTTILLHEERCAQFYFARVAA